MRTDLPPIHNSAIYGWLIFINEFEWNLMRGPGNKVDSAAWWYVPAVGGWRRERRFIVYNEPCELCLGPLRQTEACRFVLCGHHNATKRERGGKKKKRRKLRAEQNGLLQGNRAGSPSSWTISAVVKFRSLTPYRSVKKQREETGRAGDETEMWRGTETQWEVEYYTALSDELGQDSQ